MVRSQPRRKRRPRIGPPRCSSTANSPKHAAGAHERNLGSREGTTQPEPAAVGRNTARQDVIDARAARDLLSHLRGIVASASSRQGQSPLSYSRAHVRSCRATHYPCHPGRLARVKDPRQPIRGTQLAAFICGEMGPGSRDQRAVARWSLGRDDIRERSNVSEVRSSAALLA